MPITHELFGYRLSDKSAAAVKSRRRALCPFMGSVCDGGGNRSMAKVWLKNDAALRARFDGVGNEVHCGICSISAKEEEWVVCPRRILCFRNGGAGQSAALARLLQTAGWQGEDKLAVWREVKIIAKRGREKFVYSFDYVLRRLKNNKPFGEPLVAEVMTCSTSGGNRAKGNDIQTAFCKAALGEEHSSPGVNLRQVWARMASQLIVKSVAARAWGGYAVWIIQDKLAEYVNATTGLDLNALRANELNEVNLLAFSYNKEDAPKGARELRDSVLYAGPIDSGGDGSPCFLDIMKPPFAPNFAKLESVLKRREFDIIETK